MREFIKKTLVEVHLTCSTDQYGQMGQYNLSMYSLFKERVDEVKEYLSIRPILKLATYGGVGGTYTAITEIVDEEIRVACIMALRANKNRQRNLSTW